MYREPWQTGSAGPGHHSNSRQQECCSRPIRGLGGGLGANSSPGNLLSVVLMASGQVWLSPSLSPTQSRVAGAHRRWLETSWAPCEASCCPGNWSACWTILSRIGGMYISFLLHQRKITNSSDLAGVVIWHSGACLTSRCYLPCWTRQGLSSHAFLWHFSSLSRLRDSVTLGLETVGTLYSALHHYNAGPAERLEILTSACARHHQPWPLGETDRHHTHLINCDLQSSEDLSLRNCVLTNTFSTSWEKVVLCESQKSKRKKRSAIVSI